MAKTKQVIVMRTDLNMRKGKMAAQAAHASLGIFTDFFRRTDYDGLRVHHIAFSEPFIDWLDNSFIKICVGIDSEEELLALYNRVLVARVPCKLITDNGTTEFNGVPTITCLAIGPDYNEKIDKFTKDLKLL